MNFLRNAIAALSAAIVLVGAARSAGAAPAEHVLTFADGLDLTELNPLRPEAAPNGELNYLTMAYLTRYGKNGIRPELLAVLPTQHNGGAATVSSSNAIPTTHSAARNSTASSTR